MKIRNKVRNLLCTFPVLFKILRKIYYLPRFKIPKEKNIKEIIDVYCQRNEDIVFVQIGANNGEDAYSEYWRNKNWRCLFVEPQKQVFDQLKSNIKGGGDRLIVVNAAISDTNETKILYKLSVSNESWATGIASFEKHHIIKHIKKGYLDASAKRNNVSFDDAFGKDDLEKFIIEEEVICIRLNNLLLEYDFDKVDILVVDTEGHDYSVIKSIDFEKVLPGIIIFEYVNLSKSDYKKCIKLLKSKGYIFYSEYVDIIALLNKSKII